jgi:GNAT superfamily N-acetyltransferase
MITTGPLTPQAAAPLVAAYAAEMRGVLHGTAVADEGAAVALLGDALLIGAFDAGVPIGFLLLLDLPEIVFARRCGQVEDLFILSSHRRRGAARALLAAAADEARARRFSHLRWFVPEADAAAIALYETMAERAGWRGFILRLDGAASL